MSQKKYLYEASIIRNLINAFLGAKADNKEKGFLDTLKKHDDTLAKIFNGFNDKVDKNYNDMISRMQSQGIEAKYRDDKDTYAYKALRKYLEESIQRTINKKK